MKLSPNLLLSLATLMVAAVSLWPAPAPVSHIYFDRAPDRAEIIAHGGGQGHAPPNTLLALQRATGMGADVLEADVQQTRDGVLILRHDDTLDRTTNLTGLIAEYDWVDLADADAGARTEIDGERLAGQGITIPRLEEAFAAFPDARWILEIKNDTPRAAEAMCAEIQAADAEQRVLVGSFHDQAMAQFRQACPNVATSMSSAEVRDFVIAARLGLSRFVRTPAMAMQIPVSAEGMDLTHPRVLAAAHARGLRVQYWTINDPDEMQALLDAGADGLITDFVDRGFTALTTPNQSPE
ncbi:MAG: glycerophosphodiester phosphodiesterase [Hyphomonadaceae bacterium]|nr:glycerophosphodiester phosphodiesterase [Hyphomonadaceae bacterium]